MSSNNNKQATGVIGKSFSNGSSSFQSNSSISSTLSNPNPNLNQGSTISTGDSSNLTGQQTVTVMKMMPLVGATSSSGNRAPPKPSRSLVRNGAGVESPRHQSGGAALSGTSFRSFKDDHRPSVGSTTSSYLNNAEFLALNKKDTNNVSLV